MALQPRRQPSSTRLHGATSWKAVSHLHDVGLFLYSKLLVMFWSTTPGISPIASYSTAGQLQTHLVASYKHMLQPVSVFRTSNNPVVYPPSEHTHHLIPSLPANSRHIMQQTTNAWCMTGSVFKTCNSALVTASPPHPTLSFIPSLLAHLGS
jgi:hypothetical protein